MSDPVMVGVFGAKTCGKTALALAYIKGEAQEGYIPTIEDEFFKNAVIDGKEVEVGIIDTAGQDDFPEMMVRYFQDCQVFVFIYSLVDPESLSRAEEIWSDAVKECGNIKCMLVGNYSQKVQDSTEVVRDEDAEALASKMCCKHVKVSSVDYNQIAGVFEDAARLVIGNGSAKSKSKESKPKKKGFFSRLFGKKK